MRNALVALTVAVAAVVPLGCTTSHSVVPVTPDETAVMAAVHQFIDGFNANDLNKAKAACTNEMSIIDDIPPHEWHGAGAFDRWGADYDSVARRDAITDGVVTLGAARHVDISGDRGYVVTSVDFAFKQKGKPVVEKDASLTVALQKSATGWRITGWAWTKS
jgi:hypothetical protein